MLKGNVIDQTYLIILYISLAQGFTMAALLIFWAR